MQLGGRACHQSAAHRFRRRPGQICLVGSKHFNVFGSQGSDAHVSVCHYNTIEECCADLRENKGETEYRENRRW